MPDTLTTAQVDQFVGQGFVKLDQAFSAELAEAAVELLWQDLPVNRTDPSSWTEPVIRLGMYRQPPFLASVAAPRLHAAFDQLVGAGNWMPPTQVGTFPVRFPSETRPPDDGRHVDASFPGKDPTDYLTWRVNVRSRGRALLMLMLYSEVGERDAPTVIYQGSHQDVARLLYPHGDAGLSFLELAAELDHLPEREAVHATGAAGTVYLCHPFLVHAAQAHRGTTPKFMAQPALLLREELCLSAKKIPYTPLEQAIRRGIDDQ